MYQIGGMSFINWWFIPLIITTISGIITPIAGFLIMNYTSITDFNIITYPILPGLAIANALGADESIGGLITSFLTIFTYGNKSTRQLSTGLLGFGLLIIPLLSIRIDLEAVLFGDLLTANFVDLIRSIIACIIVMLVMLSINSLGELQMKLFIYFAISAVIVSSMPVAGFIFCVSLLALPLNCKIKDKKCWIKSSLLGLVINLSSFGLSILLNLSPGPIISVIALIERMFSTTLNYNSTELIM